MFFGSKVMTQNAKKGKNEKLETGEFMKKYFQAFL